MDPTLSQYSLTGNPMSGKGANGKQLEDKNREAVDAACLVQQVLAALKSDQGDATRQMVEQMLREKLQADIFSAAETNNEPQYRLQLQQMAEAEEAHKRRMQTAHEAHRVRMQEARDKYRWAMREIKRNRRRMLENERADLLFRVQSLDAETERSKVRTDLMQSEILLNERRVVDLRISSDDKKTHIQ